MNSIFRFKQFEIRHQHSAMKVGTDAVLLGAWADFVHPKTILDIGTGTGILSLMMAQRYPNSQITAIDIDELACREVKQNVDYSPFADRISVEHISLQHFVPLHQFDAIICNPPFFVDGLKTPNDQRNLARHSDSLSLKDLVEAAVKCLKPTGEFALIIPFNQWEEVAVLADKYSLHTNRLTYVKGHSSKPFKRALMQLSFVQKPLNQNELEIEIERHVYTQPYIELVKDFYLKM